MNITLIKPPILHKGVSFARYATPPLGLAYIAGTLVSQGNNVKVIDASAEGFHSKKHYIKDIYVFGLDKEEIVNRIDDNVAVICLSLMFTSNWLYDREVINHLRVKFPKSIIIAGGEHVNALPEYSLRNSSLDFVVLGEGEETIKDLVNALKNKTNLRDVNGIAYLDNQQYIKTKPRLRISKIDQIPWPAWELFPLDLYFKYEMSFGMYRGKTLPVNATRGCPYTCTFCSNPQMWGKKYEMRPPADFVDELEFLHNKYDVANFDLYDLTAIIFKDWIIEMCNEIINRKLNITYQLPSGTRSEAITAEVARLLFESGCKNIAYAPESGSKKVLKEIKKNVKIDRMLQSIKFSNEAGLNVKLNMVIGFPDDTHNDIWRTFWFLIKCSWFGAKDASPAVFSPYPGSELFDRLLKENKISLDSNDYFIDILNTYDVMPPKVFSNHLSATSIKIYIFLFVFFFYGSNYLFRPLRFLKTIFNIIKGVEDNKIEQIIRKNLVKPIIERT